MTFRAWALAFSLALSGCANSIASGSTPAVNAAPACEMSAQDRAWIERALAAWRYSARAITGIGRVPNFQAVFFDAHCTLTSPNAFETTGRVTWSAALHGDTVTLPDGSQIPAGVNSFSHSDGAHTFMVMSTPSVWAAGGVGNPDLGLETMMVAVLLHEGSHVSQSGTYGARMEALSQANHLPDDFNDDSIQHRFQGNAAFAASVQQETDLLYQAAGQADRAQVIRLARQARSLMRTRYERYFTGADAYLSEAEDIWLTMEGSGQWAGYQWVIDPHGAAQPASVAMSNFARRSRWWTQNEGLALFLVLDRLTGPAWKRHAFHDGAKTVLQMLDMALS